MAKEVEGFIKEITSQAPSLKSYDPLLRSLTYRLSPENVGSAYRTDPRAFTRALVTIQSLGLSNFEKIMDGLALKLGQENMGVAFRADPWGFAKALTEIQSIGLTNFEEMILDKIGPENIGLAFKADPWDFARGLIESKSLGPKRHELLDIFFRLWLASGVGLGLKEMGKIGLTVKDIGRLFFVRSIDLVERGGVGTTFFTVSWLMLRGLPDITVDNSGVPKKDAFGLEGTSWYAGIDELLEVFNLKSASSPRVIGRTLICPLDDGRKLVIKLAQGMDEPRDLDYEAAMLTYLGKNKELLGVVSDLPQPIRAFKDGCLFKLKALPLSPEKIHKQNIHPEKFAIAYLIPKDIPYLTYLNDKELPTEEFYKAALRNIQDLARLARYLIIHQVLIPLYHSFEDQDPYRIFISTGAGRLERWIKSCEFPNLRVSGIADLEHLESFDHISPTEYRDKLGDQLFSWTLIISSYFKLKHNFEEEKGLFKALLRDGFNTYYSIITQGESVLDECIDWESLANRMIEVMGRDEWKHDGVNPDLGPFNGPFPIQELIRAIYLASSLATREVFRPCSKWVGSSPGVMPD